MAALPLVSQSKLTEEIAEATGYSKSEVRVFFAALEQSVAGHVSQCERVKFAQVTVEPALKKATKKRMGRNPQTGEEVQIAAKPASVKVKARVAKPAQAWSPSTRKLSAAKG